MIRIGLLGGSSQVGASVAFFLNEIPDVKVTCFIRSTYSEVFFRLLGIECDLIDLLDESLLREKIGQFDVILDFAYPTGQLHEILHRSKENTGRILHAMKKDGAYFYMSSIMAYGMPDQETWIRHYRLPRNPYSYIKRSIEKYAFSRGKKEGIKIFNFRLGQVHGFLQSVNGSFRKKLSETNIAMLNGNPEDPVNIIFISQLCEAILQCARGVNPPGLYTLVSNPQWSLRQLYEYYIKYYDLQTHLLFRPEEKKKAGKSIFQKGIDLAKPYRPILETYILMRMPSLATGIKGRFRQSELLQHSNAPGQELGYIDFNLLGSPPFEMISGLTSDPDEIMKIEKDRELHYNTIILSRRQ
jgi:nucleoside-diphosphate-sugar epimerase